MRALSFSSMKLAECPFAFNAIRIAKTFKEPSSTAMDIGSLFADMVYAYREHCFSSDCPSDIGWWDTAKMDASLDPEVRDGVMPMIESFKSSEFAVIPVGRASWWKMEWQAAFDENLRFIEGDDAWFSKKAAFRAVVDFIYRDGDELVIIDDKTGRARPDDLQLQIYAHLMPRALGMNPEKITCIFNKVVTGKKHVVEYAPALVSHVGDVIKAKIKEVNSWTEFPAVACSNCKWCKVPGCPLKADATKDLVLNVQNHEVAKYGGAPSLRVPDSIATKDEAERALQFVCFAENVVDEVKSLLRGYVEANGPVDSAGKIAELRANEPWKAGNIERIVKTLAAYGIPVDQIWGALSLSESAIEKLLKKNKQSERLAVLLSMGERKAYKPRFGIYNHADDQI